tara:strand:- start:155 stop:421 length:267 start_codon:yes stop_codon:yes gene_type:complete
MARRKRIHGKKRHPSAFKKLGRAALGIINPAYGVYSSVKGRQNRLMDQAKRAIGMQQAHAANQEMIAKVEQSNMGNAGYLANVADENL